MIINTMWFTNAHGTVGIARVQTQEGIRYYISTVPGFDEQHDAQRIADWGSSFPTEAGDALFGIPNEFNWIGNTPEKVA